MSIAARIKADPRFLAGDDPHVPDSFWHSLKQLNAFRFLLAFFFATSVFFPESLQVLSSGHQPFLFLLAILYFAVAVGFRALLKQRRPGFDFQLVLQLVLDIVFLTSLIHFSRSGESGLELLLTVPMAAAGLHPRRRITFFLASLATLAILAEQTYFSFSFGVAETGGYLHAAMLAIGFFTVAWIAHLLAKGTLASDEVAVEKERAASELERINAQVIQDLPYGVAVLNAEGGVLLHNQQAEFLLGMPVPPLASIFQCDHGLHALWRNWRMADGPAMAVLSVGEPVKRVRARLRSLTEDRSDGAVLFIEDMSELEQEAIHMKLASLGRLTANLAHEIRNPLSAINHASQLLREDAGQDPATAKLTRIIEDNVSRLNFLVEDVLLLSRRDRQNRENIVLAEYLAEFVAQYRQSEDVPEEVVCLDVDPGLSIDFDRIHLHQILWNLMRNAYRHCSRRSCSIQLSAVAAGDLAQIELYNDGPAIPADLRQRLFEPFYTTDRAGTGLGLYIALELAEANEGQLRCLDQAQGARFRLSARLHK